MTAKVVYSPYIQAIVDWLRRNGVAVYYPAPHLEKDQAVGRYEHVTREIWLNDPLAYSALMTIAHEAGHWLGWLIDPKEHSYQRERQAFVYGWWVLQQFGAPVDRTVWIHIHRIDRRMKRERAEKHARAEAVPDSRVAEA